LLSNWRVVPPSAGAPVPAEARLPALMFLVFDIYPSKLYEHMKLKIFGVHLNTFRTQPLATDSIPNLRF
jgi:hypothetical protein